MTTTALRPTLEWETHRAGHRGPRTATAFYGGQECVSLTGRGPLLRLRVALWSALLGRSIRQSRSH